MHFMWHRGVLAPFLHIRLREAAGIFPRCSLSIMGPPPGQGTRVAWVGGLTSMAKGRAGAFFSCALHAEVISVWPTVWRQGL
jgi:hypothetical protein